MGAGCSSQESPEEVERQRVAREEAVAIAAIVAKRLQVGMLTVMIRHVDRPIRAGYYPHQTISLFRTCMLVQLVVVQSYVEARPFSEHPITLIS